MLDAAVPEERDGEENGRRTHWTGQSGRIIFITIPATKDDGKSSRGEEEDADPTICLDRTIYSNGLMITVYMFARHSQRLMCRQYYNIILRLLLAIKELTGPTYLFCHIK